MCKKSVSRIFIVLVAGLAVGAAHAGVDYADPPGGWAYIYTGDACATPFDACLDGTWHHYDAGSGGSDAWDGSAPGQMGTSPTKPSPGGAGVFTEAGVSFLRIQDCGDPRDPSSRGWTDPSNRKITFTHNITNEVPNPTTILNDGVTLSFRARIPTTPPLDPLYPDGGNGPLDWVTSGYNIHDDGYGAFGIKQGQTGLGIVSFSLAMDSDEGDISANGLTMNKRVGTAVSGSVDSYDAGGTENTLSGFDPTQWHEFWIQIVGDTSGGATHKVTIWMDGNVDNPATFHVTAGTKHEGNYDSWGGYLAMSIGRTNIAGSQDVDFFGYKAGLHAPAPSREPEFAWSPSPKDKAADIYRKAVLSWNPGDLARTHDVYFGTVLDDVRDASRTDTRGVLVSQGQDANTYEPQASLMFSTVYYWRIDEVSAPPSPTIFKGDVWSFTVEQVGATIQGVLATASSSQPGTKPESTVDRSGLDENDGHSADGKDMWLSAGIQPNWIQFEFDKVYKLHEMWIWNSNQQMIESFMGFGAKDVTIEYSLDAVEWSKLGDVQVLQAQGLPGYAHEPSVSLDGVEAKFVRLTIQNTWGGLARSGLSEVRFFYVPVWARLPQPDDGATDQALDVTMQWRPGRDAVSHDLYFSSDRQAVVDGTAFAGAVTVPRFDVASLDYAATYFWKVVEVNEAATPPSWEGPVWQFATEEYRLIDGFEEYTNDSPNRVFQTWNDGWGFSADEFFPNGSNGNGTMAEVGYDPTLGDIMEKAITHDASGQSVRYKYRNADSPYYSEMDRVWPMPQDWTVGGATHLTMWVHGYPATPQSIAVAETAGKMTLAGAGADIWLTSDEFTFAYKTLNGNGSLVARVVSNGTGTNTWAKGGVMIRETLASGSAHAMMVITGGGGNGAAFQRRLETDGDSASTDALSAVAPPYWVKVERSGNTFTGHISSDEANWVIRDTVEIPMADPVYIGLCVTSHVAGTDRTYEFDNIKSTGSVTGQWQGAVIDSPKYNSPAVTYITLQDSVGKSFTLTDPNTAKVSIAGWRPWTYPLNQFTGVNMSGVKKMVIGVGNKNPGGPGELFIDDIRLTRPEP